MSPSERFIHGAELDAEIAARKHDVDVSLLRENLKLTPTERLRKHQSIAAFVGKLREAGKQSRQ